MIQKGFAQYEALPSEAIVQLECPYWWFSHLADTTCPEERLNWFIMVDKCGKLVGTWLTALLNEAFRLFLVQFVEFGLRKSTRMQRQAQQHQATSRNLARVRWRYYKQYSIADRTKPFARSKTKSVYNGLLTWMRAKLYQSDLNNAYRLLPQREFWENQFWSHTLSFKQLPPTQPMPQNPKWKKSNKICEIYKRIWPRPSA